MHEKKKKHLRYFFSREKLYVIYIKVRFFCFWNGIKILQAFFRVYSGLVNVNVLHSTFGSSIHLRK